jgi:protein-disulfide isomerase
MYRLMTLALTFTVLSFNAYADCGSCKKECKKEAYTDQLVDVDFNGGIVLGIEDAEHSIIFYTDAECSFCHQAYQNLQELRSKWKDKLNIIVKQSPLHHHKKAQELARYTLALGMQDKKMAAEFTEHLYQNPKVIHAGKHGWLEVAKSLKADIDQLQLDLTTQVVEQKLAQELEMARSLGVRATPSFVIAGQLITGNRSVTQLESYLLAETKN